jgi:class 3 adenylate cyclase/predicted ATPase
MMEIGGSTHRVGDWLDSIGLRQYAETFAQNAITWELLQDLGDQDLRELGVSALGHRKVLLRAVTALRSEVPGDPGVRSPTAMHWARGERRQITVMTCDLVNSVELSARFDPEDLAEVVSGYQSCCEGVVRQFDGYVARFTGDGLKAYFGYPCASEYDPERAVRAGLALISAVRGLELRAGLVLSTRVGIATGDVVVGEVIGTGEAQERTVAGETPNLAARLQVLGEPDSVTIADTTKRLIGRLFEYADMGRSSLKGFPEPMQAWRVLTEGPTGSHFDAVRTETSLTPLVGRDEELAFLRHHWPRVKTREGQTVLLSGEAGIGKSRLTIALQRSLAEESFRVLRYYCSPYHRNSSFYPIIKQLEQAARFLSSDAPEVKLDKLENLVLQSELDMSHVVPLFASLLSIPTEARYLPLSFSPRQQKRLVLDALEEKLTRLTAKTPLLMVFEDLHWVDPSTREFLDRLIKRVPELPVLLVMTCRPDFEPRWQHNLKVTTRPLDRLPRRESELLVGVLDPRSSLPPKTLKQILDYSDGIPLFLEELTKAALAGKPEQDKGGDRATIAPASTIRVPRTLHDSLLARLDRLGRWKQVAQTGAVIGRSFSFKLLVALFPQDQAVLVEALQGLIRAELIVERGKPPEATYTFTHALLQEAASACLLYSDRRTIHQRIAQVLEKEFPETVKTEPELLALHYTGAGLTNPAIIYWRKAAERALQRSANVEAAHHFGQGLALLDALPQSVERDQQELDLQTHLGATLTTVKGFAAPEVATAYERARALCRESQDSGQRFSVLRGLWVYDLVRAEWQAAADLAEEMLALARDRHNAGYELEGHRALGMTLLWRGLLVRAHDHLKEGRRLYDPEQHHIHAFRYGNDPGVACLVHEALVLWMLGYPDRALATSYKAITLARRLAHPFSLTQALIYTIFIHQCRGEVQNIQKLTEEAKTLAIEHGFPFWLAEAGIMAGWAAAAQGGIENGIIQMRNGITDFLATGARMDRPRWLALLAEAYGTNNQSQEGLKAVSEALRVAEETKECLFQARLCQLNGELLLKEGAPGAAARAESNFCEALAIAGRQQAKSWELCAATSLARLWCGQFKRREAYNLLAPVYDWFTEGFDTADVKDAKALLDQLALDGPFGASTVA